MSGKQKVSPSALATLPRVNSRTGKTGSCSKDAAKSSAKPASVLRFLPRNKGCRLKEFKTNKIIYKKTFCHKELMYRILKDLDESSCHFCSLRNGLHLNSHLSITSSSMETTHAFFQKVNIVTSCKGKKLIESLTSVKARKEAKTPLAIWIEKT